MDIAPRVVRKWVAGAPCDLLEEADFWDMVREGAEGGEVLRVASYNLNHVYHYGHGGALEGFFDDAKREGREWLITVDGVPVWRRLQKHTKRAWPKLSGSDLVETLLQESSDKGWRVAVLGGDTADSSALRGKCALRWPELVVRTWCPSRSELVEDRGSIAREIAEFGARVVLVSLPKPLEEGWIDTWGDESGAGVLCAFGSAVSFFAGIQVRAPKLWQKSGLEWAWRLLHRPRAMVKRYLVEGPREWWLVRREVAERFEPASPDYWRRTIRVWLVAMDAALAVVASFGASGVRSVIGGSWLRGYSPQMRSVVVAIPLMILFIGLSGGWRAGGQRIDSHLMGRFFKGVVSGVASIGLVSFAFRWNVSRGYVAILGVFVLLGGMAGRYFLSQFMALQRKKGRWSVRTGVVGDSEPIEQLLSWWGRHRELGYRIIWRSRGLDVVPVEALGLLCVGDSSGSALAEADEVMRGRGEVLIIPDLVSVDATRLRAETYADQTVLHVMASDLSVRAAVVKRSMDLVVALSALILASPIIGFAAWRIHKEDGGPVFFRQQRVGLDGGEFTLWKLRTMEVGAEGKLGELAHLNKAGPYQTKVDDDPRITRVGATLRRTSLDELPQLVNVVRGDMSLVGPRPALAAEVALYPHEGHRRHRVRPGLTGLWQVSGRSDLGSEQALALDLHYVANWSLGKDISILVRTVRVVLGRDGAQ